MKKLFAFVLFLALISWGAKSAIESANKHIDEVNVAAQKADGTDLYSMLPSGEGNKTDDAIEAIAPAAGDDDAKVRP